ncbi:hypothetical protein KM043_010942 [Ampulex compressa]|nr:hypothetical protein KM043_010942 [Ampulex compressa]
MSPYEIRSRSGRAKSNFGQSGRRLMEMANPPESETLLDQRGKCNEMQGRTPPGWRKDDNETTSLAVPGHGCLTWDARRLSRRRKWTTWSRQKLAYPQVRAVDAAESAGNRGEWYCQGERKRKSKPRDADKDRPTRRALTGTGASPAISSRQL